MTESQLKIHLEKVDLMARRLTLEDIQMYLQREIAHINKQLKMMERSDFGTPSEGEKQND
jgi:uncharacterized protein YydD (DUF2326 family)